MGKSPLFYHIKKFRGCFPIHNAHLPGCLIFVSRMITPRILSCRFVRKSSHTVCVSAGESGRHPLPTPLSAHPQQKVPGLQEDACLPYRLPAIETTVDDLHWAAITSWATLFSSIGITKHKISKTQVSDDLPVSRIRRSQPLSSLVSEALQHHW